jgi:hypothetical protein
VVVLHRFVNDICKYANIIMITFEYVHTKLTCMLVFLLQDGSTPLFELCDECHLQLKKNSAGPLSIAKGCDFGNPHHIGLSSLTELERVILANARMYSSVVQLTAGVHKGRSVGKVLRGHFIYFFQVCFNLMCTKRL